MTRYSRRFARQRMLLACCCLIGTVSNFSGNGILGMGGLRQAAAQGGQFSASDLSEPDLSESVLGSSIVPSSSGLQMSDYATPVRWVSADFLLWWRRGQSIPVLATTSPLGTSQQQAGLLGRATTQTLFGGRSFAGDASPGGRISLGSWLDQGQTAGVGGRFFQLGGNGTRFRVDARDNPIVAQPFFNIATRRPDARLVNFPGVSTGAITVDSQSDVMGSEAYYRRALFCDGRARMDLLAGYQFTQVDESLSLTNETTALLTGGTIAQGTVIASRDLFSTRNRFHGGLIGVQAEVNRGNWSFLTMGKVAVGTMRQSLVVTGQTTVTVPTVTPVTTGAGLFAQPSNIGVYQNDQVVTIPELDLQLIYHMSPGIELTFGYGGLFISDVVQPGSQIDPNIDAIGGSRPLVPLVTNSYWLHGIRAGVEFQY